MIQLKKSQVVTINNYPLILTHTHCVTRRGIIVFIQKKFCNSDFRLTLIDINIIGIDLKLKSIYHATDDRSILSIPIAIGV